MIVQTETSLRIIYMGTPEFAVAPLKALLDNGFDVAAVVTVPDRPKGRGLELAQSDVKKFAVAAGLPVLQPEKLRDENFLKELASFNADLFIVVAFRMLPQCVWQMPHLGTFNLHGSLLPKYRGAAPINWAIINGEKETGVTTFFIDEQIDTGKILMQRKCRIEERETIGTLYDKLMSMGAELVVETVNGLISGTLQPRPQEEPNKGIANALQTTATASSSSSSSSSSAASKSPNATSAESQATSPIASSSASCSRAPKITKETCRINWNHTAEKIDALVRGLSPYPCATAVLIRPEETKGKTTQTAAQAAAHETTVCINKNCNEKYTVAEKTFDVKIIATEKPSASATDYAASDYTHSSDADAGPVPSAATAAAGTIISDGKTYMEVICGSGTRLRISEIQLSGKKRMKTEEFLRGFRLCEGCRFGSSHISE